MNNWLFKVEDQEVVSMLQSFIPEKIFDAHAKIQRGTDLKMKGTDFPSERTDEISIDVWRMQQEQQLGTGKMKGGLFFPVHNMNVEVDKENDYLINQLANQLDSRGLVLIHPKDAIEKVSAYLKNPKIVGFKPLHVYSSEKPNPQSVVKEFSPEWMWQLANEQESIIMLQMSRHGQTADSDNQKEVQELCKKYPRAKIILAYCADSFCVPNAIDIKVFRGLENIWFDISGIIESEPIENILYEFGPQKILWGSDFPISETREKAVTSGNELARDNPGFLKKNTACTHSQPTSGGLESLLALKHAADSFGLNREDIKDIFFENAMRLTGISKMESDQTQALYEYGKKCIPGGTQLLSKRPEMMAPSRWPAYFREARGCEVWDLDGKHYYDMSTNGIGSCLLGYRDHDVTQAVKRRLNLGSMSTLNPPEEVELADRLLELHPWANQARFTRAGGEACAVAVRVARATTDRSIVAVCGYHGWQDWYLAANLGDSDLLRGHLLPGLNPKGVPSELRNTTVSFTYNDKEALQKIIDQYGSDLAAVIMEPCRGNDPEVGFLEFVRDKTRKNGTVLIFDEITVGFRLHQGGAHLKYNVAPDMAVFAKALGNGHPIAAIIGTIDAMEGAHESFISSTYWTESIGPTAAVATLKKMSQNSVPDYIDQVGKSVEAAWAHSGKSHQLPIKVGGSFSCFAKFEFNHPDANKLKTLYTQKMLDRGFLAGLSIYPTLAHDSDVINLYSEAIDDVFGEISNSLKNDEELYIKENEVAHTGFARLI